MKDSSGIVSNFWEAIYAVNFSFHYNFDRHRVTRANLTSARDDVIGRPTFVGALAHPPAAHGETLGGLGAGAVLVGALGGDRVIHLGLDEELQDVVVVPPPLAVVERAQHHATAVQATVQGVVHQAEPRPRLGRTPRLIPARRLVGLLQVLTPRHT